MEQKKEQKEQKVEEQIPFWEQIKECYFEELPDKLKKELLKTVIQLATIRAKKRRGKYFLEKESRNINVEQLRDMYENGELQLPIFQRGKVWDAKKKSELIYTLLTGGVIPEIITYEDNNGIRYLLDGFQRTSTIIDFINNQFKLKLDPNIEHLDPRNTDKQELIKNMFERLNYKSTPLSKYRVILLTIYTLTENKNQEEREELEEKIGIIQKTAQRIKEEDRQENNLGFVLRVLTGIRTYELMENNPEELENIKNEMKTKNFSDYMIKVLKPYIKQIEKKELENILERLYEIGYILTRGKLTPLASPQGQRNAEAIALLLYKLKRKEFNLIDNEDRVDYNEIVEIVNLLKDREEDLLKETGRKNPSATKDYKLYLIATEGLLKDLINWDKIITTPISIEEKAEGKIEEETKGKTEEKIENGNDESEKKQETQEMEQKEEKEEENYKAIFENT